MCPYLFIVLKERVLPSANVFTTTFTPFCGAWSREPSRLKYCVERASAPSVAVVRAMPSVVDSFVPSVNFIVVLAILPR